MLFCVASPLICLSSHTILSITTASDTSTGDGDATKVTSDTSEDKKRERLEVEKVSNVSENLFICSTHSIVHFVSTIYSLLLAREHRQLGAVLVLVVQSSTYTEKLEG